MKNLIIHSIAFLLLFSACEKKKQETVSSTNTKKSFIVLKPEQMDLMDIELGEIKEIIITPIVFANGRVIANPESQASVSSLIGGRVDQIYFKEGDFVRKNQTIATLSSLELLNLQQEFYTTVSELEFAKVELARQKELAKQKVGALADLQLSESKHNALKAKTLSLKSKLNLVGFAVKEDTISTETVSARFSLVSPINGRINKLPIHIGKQLQPNELAATLINNEKMRAEVYCYERDINMIHDGMNIEIEFANLSIPKVSGKVESISQNVDDETKSIKVYVSFAPPAGVSIVPQMSVYVKIESRRSDKKVKTVPLTAIYEEDNINYIFHTTGEKNDSKELYFKKTKVVVLSNDGNNAEIRLFEELPRATKVVIHNTFAMEIESRKAGL